MLGTVFAGLWFVIVVIFVWHLFVGRYDDIVDRIGIVMNRIFHDREEEE